jgi:hypothetical protein
VVLWVSALGVDPTQLLPQARIDQCEGRWRRNQADAAADVAGALQALQAPGGEGRAGGGGGGAAAVGAEFVAAVWVALQDRRLGVQTLGFEMAVPPQGILSTDILAAVGEVAVAVEVDGPTHFIAWLVPAAGGGADVAVQRRSNGATSFRNALLRRQGCAVVQVPWFAWPASRAAQVALMQELLAEQGLVRGALLPGPGPRALGQS